MDSFNNNIDNLFKDALGEYAETPPPAVWEALEKRLDDKKKRAAFPYRWLWYIGSVLMFILLGLQLGKDNVESLLAIRGKGDTAPGGDLAGGSQATDNTTTPIHKKQVRKKRLSITNANTTAAITPNTSTNNPSTPTTIEPNHKTVIAHQETKDNSRPTFVEDSYDTESELADNNTDFYYNDEEEEQITFGRKPAKVKAPTRATASPATTAPSKEELYKTATASINKATIAKSTTDNIAATNNTAKTASSASNKQAGNNLPTKATSVAKNEAEKIDINKNGNSRTTVEQVTKQKTVNATATTASLAKPGLVETTTKSADKVQTEKKTLTNTAGTNSAANSIKDVDGSHTATKSVANTKPVVSKPIAKTEIQHKTHVVKSVAATQHKATQVNVAAKPTDVTAASPSGAIQATASTTETTANKPNIVANNRSNVTLSSSKVVSPKKHTDASAAIAHHNADNVAKSATPAQNTKSTSEHTTVKSNTNEYSASVVTHKKQVNKPVSHAVESANNDNSIVVNKPKKAAKEQKNIAAKSTGLIAGTPTVAHANGKKKANGKHDMASDAHVPSLTGENITPTANIGNKTAATKNGKKNTPNSEPITAATNNNTNTKQELAANHEIVANSAPIAKVEPAKIDLLHMEDTALPHASTAVMPENKQEDPNSPKKFKGIEAGVKMGYESSWQVGSANKIAIAGYFEKRFSSKFSVMVQPSIKSAVLSSRSIDGTQSFYSVDQKNTSVTHDSVMTLMMVTPIGYDTVWKRNYTYKQGYDSITKSYAVKGSYIEFELPILMKYRITDKLSVYGGLNLLYSKTPSIKEISTSIRKENITYYSITGILPTPPPDPSTMFSYSGNAISNYKGPLYPENGSGNFRIGYMIGFSYEFKKRWMTDVLIQQAPTKQNVQGGYNINTALSNTYFRLSVGFKLFEK